MFKVAHPRLVVVTTLLVLIVASNFTVKSAALLALTIAVIVMYARAVGWAVVGQQCQRLMVGACALPWWAQALALAAVWLIVPVGSWLVLGLVLVLARNELVVGLFWWRSVIASGARSGLRRVLSRI